MFKLRIGVLILLLVTVVNAVKFNDTKVDGSIAEINEDVSSSTDIGTSRLKRYLPFYGGSALLGLGGLHSLAILYAIKVKIIVVAVVIALAIYFYAKIYLKHCLLSETIRETNPYESFSNYGPSGYSNSLPAGIGYPGTDSFSSHASPYENDHDSVSIADIIGSKLSLKQSLLTKGKDKMIRRVYNQMRQFTNPLFQNIDWSDMGLQLLGLDSDDCRRRFTCELDFRIKELPFSSYIFSSDSPKFLNKYRELSKDVNNPITFSDCALFYQECKYL